ncbi:PEP-CTERM sorting domain-containing protein [Verrucomicrobiaceae bacterium 5K15]|uniref:PEP-CTERM sorting domain-containing protein n=1 Tax=Oceaniferula flava TaxID=2800421 RepID=A0AAE2V8I4_9BACT|nr:PEP-CTERM sorting domain-containing protein [Oceaniferula flavus]MBK1855612.1 PEP-CTERM sorting domain-containing protein [Oceaniferula flavus]MBM1136918.1 PEP-CTERM sorting domain-containing protein [Oceaniferula flavus]
MKPLNQLLLVPTLGAVSLLHSAHAAIIYNASTSNSGIVGNAVNLTSNSFTGTTGALTVTTDASGNNNASGIASNDDINTLKGSALLATDTVTMKMIVTNTTGVNNLRANGIEFGMSPNGTGFRPAENLIFQIDADNDDSGMAIDNFYDPDLTLNVAGWAVTEASLADGFTVTLVADSDGFTFTLFDIEEVGNLSNTTLSYSNTFTGSQFVDNFGGGHMYYTRQGTAGEVDVNISEFSIDVTPIPEPSAAGLLGLSGLALILRRRR